MASKEDERAAPGTEVPLRELDLPVAIELAETLLIQHDLRNSLATLRLWSQRISATTASDAPDAEANIVLGSLFRDGLVRLIGCFEKSSHPLRLDEVYPNANDGAADYFKWLRDIRNSFAAHRYGAARRCVVGALVDPDKGYLGHGYLSAIYAGPASVGHSDLLRFVAVALKFADAKAARLAEQVDAEARAVPMEELLKAPVARLHGLDPEDMKKSRGDMRRDRQRQSKM